MKPITDDQKKRAAEIAQRIDVLTKTLGMPKGEFYKKANITSANFSYWRNGLNYPSRKKLADAAKALNVTVAYLEYGDDSAQKEKPTAQGDGLISGLPQDVQEIIFLCQENPQLASALLNLAQQLRNRSSDQA